MISFLWFLRFFLIAVGLNILWEFAHCMLYETCQKMRWSNITVLLLLMSLKDGFWVVVFYSISWVVFPAAPIVLFVVLSLAFSFFDERISLGLKRWEYTSAMPTIFGVGLTPLFEIAVTGTLAVMLMKLI